MEDKKFLERLLNGIARQFDFNDEITFENRNIFLHSLRNKNEELFIDLNTMINSYVVFDFVKKDRELRIKMPDMWEQEAAAKKEEWLAEKDKVHALLEKYEISFD